MAIAVRASGSVTYDVHGASSTVTQTVTKPAGVVTGDLMVATCSAGANSTPTVATPTGWTAVAANIGVSLQHTSVFYRVAQAGDATWSFSATSGSATTDFGIALQTLSGVDTVTPIDATGTTSTSTGSSTLVANAVSVVTANAWELIGMGCYVGGAASATGFTDLPDGSPASNEQADLLYNTTPKSIGSTGAVTVTQGAASGNILSAIPFAIRPAASAAAALVIPPFPSLPYAFLNY